MISNNDMHTVCTAYTTPCVRFAIVYMWIETSVLINIQIPLVNEYLLLQTHIGQFIDSQIVAHLGPMQEQFQDTKAVMRNRKLKDNQHNDNRTRTKDKGQTTIYKTLHSKLNVEQQEYTNNWGELRCSGSVSCSCSTSGTCRVTLATNPMRNDRKVLTRIGTYLWPFVTPIFRSG